MDDPQATAPSILFVAGAARSGTTILADLLNAHPGVVIGQERYFNLSNEQRHHELTPELFAEERFFAPTAEETHNFKWRHDEKFCGFLRNKFRQARIVGDKVPNYFVYLNHLLEAFPGARMLAITRDPLRVADSWKRRQDDPEDTNWQGGPVMGIRQWNGGQQRIAIQRAKHPDRIGVVVYERLLSGDRAHLDALCAWLGAGPPDDWMSRYYAQITEGWAYRQGRPLTLTPAERELVERTARHDLRVKLLDLALS